MAQKCGILIMVSICIAVAACSAAENGASPSTTVSAGGSVTETTVTVSLSTTTTVVATTTTSGTRAATAEEQAPMNAFVEAYATQDASAMASAFEGQPEIEFYVRENQGVMWTLDLMQKDAAFSSTVHDHWTVDDCALRYGRVSCRLSIQDELGRLAGLDPATPTLSYTAVDGQWTEVVWNGFEAWDLIHREMHTYGNWYEAEYPDRAPIQGLHYRGWNVEDLTAADRYVDSLYDYLKESDAVVSTEFSEFPLPVVDGFTSVVTSDGNILDLQYPSSEAVRLVSFYDEWTASREGWSPNEPNLEIGVLGAFVHATDGGSISVVVDPESEGDSAFVLLSGGDG